MSAILILLLALLAFCDLALAAYLRLRRRRLVLSRIIRGLRYALQHEGAFGVYGLPMSLLQHARPGE
jgi:hypothetical protein